MKHCDNMSWLFAYFSLSLRTAFGLLQYGIGQDSQHFSPLIVDSLIQKAPRVITHMALP